MVGHEEEKGREAERDDERHEVEDAFEGRAHDGIVTRRHHLRRNLDVDHVVEIADVGHQRDSFAHQCLSKVRLVSLIS